MSKGKIVIISAPSGCGKSTIVGRIIDDSDLRLRFSVSATNRSPREGEQHGTDYYFISTDDFQQHILNGDFVEYEEVYPGRFYGTLKSEIERICEQGNNCMLDIDVEGAKNVKRMFGDRALSLFICPPSIDALRQRLEGRGTDSPEEIDRRISKAAYEIEQGKAFETVVVNDVLDKAVEEVRGHIKEFIHRP